MLNRQHLLLLLLHLSGCGRLRTCSPAAIVRAVDRRSAEAAAIADTAIRQRVGRLRRLLLCVLRVLQPLQLVESSLRRGDMNS